MYVCICNSVTDRDIKKAVKQGTDTIDGICKELKVASCCGRCKTHACEVIDEACAAKESVDVVPAFTMMRASFA